MLERDVTKFIAGKIKVLGYRVLKAQHSPKGDKFEVMIDFINTNSGSIGTYDCMLVAKEIEPALNVENFIGKNCGLEVSSPGIDRPLITLEDFVNYKGHKVKVMLHQLIDGIKKCRARIEDVIDDSIVLVLYDSKKITLNINDIKSAKLSIDDMPILKSKKSKL